VAKGTSVAVSATSDTRPVDFETHPDRYRHWRLAFDGPIATLSMDVQEDGGLSGDYRLKLNSYDLGVDIELADALQRIRFEHPEVRAVVVRSLKERIFCAGANIFMLRGSSHAWKVNFCKFTNETRLAIEDASEHSGLKFLAALNDDLSTPQALSIVWKLVDAELPVDAKAKTLLWMDRVLGLKLEEYLGHALRVPPEVAKLVEQREEARKQKDWPRSDELRDQIQQSGYSVEDTDGGSKIKLN